MEHSRKMTATGKHGMMGGVAALTLAASIFLVNGNKVSAATNWQPRSVGAISSQIKTTGSATSYQIKWGDTLGNIAAALQQNNVNITSAELAKLNNMSESSLIIAGNKLTVSGSGAATKVTVKSATTQQQQTYSASSSTGSTTTQQASTAQQTSNNTPVTSTSAETTSSQTESNPQATSGTQTNATQAASTTPVTSSTQTAGSAAPATSTTDVADTAQTSARQTSSSSQAQTSASTTTSNPATTSSSVNTYPAGQCTWYVKERAPWVGNNWGNGGQWGASAAAAGYRVDHVPAVGAVVVFAPGQSVGSWTADSTYGHVAYVEAVAGNTITISQGGTGFSNPAGPNTQTISGATALTYIHPNN